MPSFFLIPAKAYSERFSTEINRTVHKAEPFSIHRGERMLRAILRHFPTPLFPSYNTLKMATSVFGLTAWSAAPKEYSQLRWDHQKVGSAHSWASPRAQLDAQPRPRLLPVGSLWCSCRDCGTIPLPFHFLPFWQKSGGFRAWVEWLGWTGRVTWVSSSWGSASAHTQNLGSNAGNLSGIQLRIKAAFHMCQQLWGKGIQSPIPS